MKRILTAVLAASSFLCSDMSAQQLEVEEAVRRALAADAELAALAAEMRASAASVRQAGRRANPEVELTVENVGANEASTETTLAVGQLLELGGDRQARVDSATTAHDITRLALDAHRLDVESRVRTAFATLVAAQQQLAITRENVASAEAAFGAIRDRVAAGKVSPIEETRASVTLSVERIELTRAEAELQRARVHLAATWGGAAGDVVATAATPVERSTAAIDAHPELRRAEAVVAQREAEARLERARAVPDLRATGGVRGYDDGDGPAAVAGVAMTLPLFDRNRDSVAAALARVEAARSEAAAIRLRLTRDLGEANVRRAAAQQNVERFRTEIIPAAESVNEAIAEGYRLGKFGYLEVLDARRTLAQARQQLVAAQRELELARIDVERLTGGWK